MPPKTPKHEAGSDTQTPSGSRTPPGGAAASQDGHSHNFSVIFHPHYKNRIAIHCDRPQTVLDAIKSTEAWKKERTFADDKLIIQLGNEDKEVIVATHFPCSCIAEDQIVIVSQQKHQVEEAGVQRRAPLLPKDQYCDFRVDTEGGLNTKSKKLFRNSKIKDFKYVCVYAERVMTVEEAVKQDGRFINELGDFKLTDIEDKNSIQERTQKVYGLHSKRFKLCLPMNKTQSGDNGRCANVQLAVALAKQRGISVYSKDPEKPNTEADLENIRELLRKQFPALRKWLETVLTAKTYQIQMDLKKNYFEKIQQSFSEVYRIQKLLRLAKSVCKISVEGICTGSGFVLVDNLIMTTAHLFSRHVENETLDQGIKVFAYFHYDVPDPEANYIFFTAKNTFIAFNPDLDYAVLELDPAGQKCKKKSLKSTNVPPGLLQTFGPLPMSGEVCLFGHPKGEVKQMDLTWIIKLENRAEAVDEHLSPHMTLFTLLSIKQRLSGQGIENILVDGGKANNVVTYNTFMYHGASGSPVFDDLGRLCGLHTSGFTYGLMEENHVIEYAQPLLTIFEDLKGQVKARGNNQLWDRLQQEASKNSYLMKILKDPKQPIDQS